MGLTGALPARVPADVKESALAYLVVVRVSDQGQGIGREFLPHVFDIFRQEDATKTRRQGGLGIGLAIGTGLAFCARRYRRICRASG